MGKKVKYGEFDPANSDGCTLIGAAFRLFTREKALPFKGCCVAHDKAYYYGGHESLRKEADDQLRRCVNNHGYPILAWIMWFFVRVFSGTRLFGLFKNPLPWSWEKIVTIKPKSEEPK